MNIVVIGGVAAGAKAAAKIKRLLPDSSVKIFTDDTHVSYSSCGLPFYIQGNFKDYRSLLVRSVEEFNQAGIDVYLEHRVTKIDIKSQALTVQNKLNSICVPYDRLIIATGARPIIPNVKGVRDFENIYTLRKIEDGIKIREQMLKSKNAVIVGGGFIGLELLEAFVKNGLNVTLLESGDKIMPSFDPEMSDEIKTRIELSDEKNFQILTGEAVVEIVGENGLATKVLTSSGKEIDAEIIVLCVGVIPNSEIAREAGIVIGKSAQLKLINLCRPQLLIFMLAEIAVKNRT